MNENTTPQETDDITTEVMGDIIDRLSEYGIDFNFNELTEVRQALESVFESRRSLLL